MVFHNAIQVIKTNTELRQVQYARIALDVFPTKEEAIAFAIKFPEGSRVEVWENEKLIDRFDK